MRIQTISNIKNYFILSTLFYFSSTCYDIISYYIVNITTDTIDNAKVLIISKEKEFINTSLKKG